MKKPRIKLIVSIAILISAVGIGAFAYMKSRSSIGNRISVVMPNGADTITIADFSKPLRLDPIEAGWFHPNFYSNPRWASNLTHTKA